MSFDIPRNLDYAATMEAIAKSGDDAEYFSLSAAEQNALILKHAVYINKPSGDKSKKAYGGRAKKKMAYGGKTMKKYAKGGGIRKAQTYG